MFLEQTKIFYLAFLFGENFVQILNTYIQNYFRVKHDPNLFLRSLGNYTESHLAISEAEIINFLFLLFEN